MLFAADCLNKLLQRATLPIGRESLGITELFIEIEILPRSANMRPLFGWLVWGCLFKLGPLARGTHLSNCRIDIDEF